MMLLFKAERELGPEAKEAIVTAGQRLIEQGLEQGREQGLELVRQRVQALVLRLLCHRFGDEVDAHVEQRLATASFDQLEVWAEGVASAASLAALFAD